MNSDTSGLGPQMLPQAMQIGGLRSHNEALNFYHCSVQLACFFSFQNLVAAVVFLCSLHNSCMMLKSTRWLKKILQAQRTQLKK